MDSVDMTYYQLKFGRDPFGTEILFILYKNYGSATINKWMLAEYGAWLKSTPITKSTADVEKRASVKIVAKKLRNFYLPSSSKIHVLARLLRLIGTDDHKLHLYQLLDSIEG